MPVAPQERTRQSSSLQRLSILLVRLRCSHADLIFLDERARVRIGFCQLEQIERELFDAILDVVRPAYQACLLFNESLSVPMSLHSSQQSPSKKDDAANRQNHKWQECAETQPSLDLSRRWKAISVGHERLWCRCCSRRHIQLMSSQQLLELRISRRGSREIANEIGRRLFGRVALVNLRLLRLNFFLQLAVRSAGNYGPNRQRETDEREQNGRDELPPVHGPQR